MAITPRQRFVLQVVSVFAMYAFLYQPKTNLAGVPMGYHYFATVESVREASDTGIRRMDFLTTDYKMLAATYAALAFVAVCFYLAAGAVRKPN